MTVPFGSWINAVLDWLARLWEVASGDDEWDNVP